jgi:hypothetical protein
LNYLPSEELAVEELFSQQRKLARSHDFAERFQTLWIGALLDERMTRCSDPEIGNLLSLVQDGLGLFSPDFAVCEHAKRRLQRQYSWSRMK